MKKLIFPFIAFWVVIIYGCSKSDEQFNPEPEHFGIENKLISGIDVTSFQRVITGNSNGHGGRNSIHLNSVKQTSDFGYIFCGTIWLYDKSGTIILKINSLGETEWLDTIADGFGSSGNKIEIVEDNNYLIIGALYEEGYNSMLMETSGLLVRIDDNGHQVWRKSFSFIKYGALVDICTTHDNGYIILGYEHDFDFNNTSSINQNFLIKTNLNGDEEWRKILNGSGRMWDIEKTKDGGFVLFGNGAEYGVNITKINGNGEEIWTSNINTGSNGIVTRFNTLQDGYVVCGIEHIAKLDSLGNTIWSKTYGVGLFEEQGYPTHYGTYYEIYDITVTGDNNFMAIGGYNGYHLDKDIAFDRAHLFKISSENGDIMWIKSLNPEEGNRLSEIQKCADNGFIIAGTTSDFDTKNGSNSDRWGYIIKTDENGN